MKMNSLALGYAGAVLSALCMFLLSIASWLGLYKEAVAQMQDWHFFYTPTVIGTVLGMVEAAIISFVALYLFGWLYNRFAK